MSKEPEVKIPVEVDETQTPEVASEPLVDEVDCQTCQAQTIDSDEATCGNSEESRKDSREMTEEEMVEAALRAGEQAADDDFKDQAQSAQAELTKLRQQLETANEALESAETKANEAVERHARLQADWENFRRRTAQERLVERERACEKLVANLLPVLDDMERACKHARSTQASEEFIQFVDGVEAVHTKMTDILGKEGVEVIDPAGEPFNPNCHQAVGRVEDESQYEDTVADVYMKGYRIGDRVIREAMVTVTYGGEKRPLEDADTQNADASDNTATEQDA